MQMETGNDNADASSSSSHSFYTFPPLPPIILPRSPSNQEEGNIPPLFDPPLQLALRSHHEIMPQIDPEAEVYSSQWQVQAHNICKAAVMELFNIAVREGLLDKQENPPMVVSGELGKKFQSAPSPGMIVELSVDSSVFQFSPAYLISNITNLVSFAPELKHVQMLDVEFHIPMPFTQRRSCTFMRFHTEVNPSVWAVVDIGIDYFPVSPSHFPKFLIRRPSGLIIKQQSAGGCKVIWIENVEACKSQSNVFQSLNVKSAFDANRWLTALEWRNLDKNYSLFESKPESHLAKDELHQLAKLLKVKFIRSISDTPDGRKWTHLTSNELMILWAGNTSIGVFNCLATFNLMEKPYAVFKKVSDLNLAIQWENLQIITRPQLEIKLASTDGINGIQVFSKDHCRLVNVTSGDGYCYVVTSMPVSQEAFLSRSWSDINPSGFAILPCFSGQVNHPGGSTVVISLSAKCNDKALKVLPHFLRLLIRIIKPSDAESAGSASSGKPGTVT
ncbi:hypothetical protein KPL70_009304 [Citrus sinensis]|nr:hypothetical protein KPL70_009304 [Citrus sinensis]